LCKSLIHKYYFYKLEKELTKFETPTGYCTQN